MTDERQQPEMQSARLAYYRHALTDYDECAEMWADPETLRFIGKPSTPEESWARLLRNAGHWALTGYGSWVLRDRETGRFAGDAGFKQFRRDIDPLLDRLPEIGWVLAPWARGQGLATEAAAASLAWADRQPAWPGTLCMIDPDNHASLRVAAKTGFRMLRDATYKEKPMTLLARRMGGEAA